MKRLAWTAIALAAFTFVGCNVSFAHDGPHGGPGPRGGGRPGGFDRGHGHDHGRGGFGGGSGFGFGFDGRGFGFGFERGGFGFRFDRGYGPSGCAGDDFRYSAPYAPRPWRW